MAWRANNLKLFKEAVMSRKANAWLPCASDFVARDFWRGGAGIVMQSSLVFWPLAYRLARQAAARRAMDERLRVVSIAYAVRRPVWAPVAPPAPVLMQEAA
jgi:hypothetical protein